MPGRGRRLSTLLVMQWIEEALLWCCISVFAYAGAYVRVGFQYYRIWKTESSVSLLYAQIIGCLVMGFMVHLRPLFMSSGVRLQRVVYTGVTTGLCGSITTFSSLNFDANKLFLLQWDSTWGDANGSYDGRRLLEWLVSIWIGVSVPMQALHAGRHLSEALFPASAFPSCPSLPAVDSTVLSMGESAVVVSYVIATVLVIFLPAKLDSSGSFKHLLFTAIFGAVGAYMRYRLSLLNRSRPTFPLGTCIANVLGSWLLAVWMVLAKFVVPQHEVLVIEVLYGLCTGFCGCLTTLSTFVNELHVLPRRAAYIYGMSSIILAQLGIFLLFDLAVQTSVSGGMAQLEPPMEFCRDFELLCTKLVERIGCPIEERVIMSCGGPHDYNKSFTSLCQCGRFDASFRVGEILVASRVSQNAAKRLVHEWPASAAAADHKGKMWAIDICVSYETACQDLLGRMTCPGELRHVKGCETNGMVDWVGMCQCASDHVAERMMMDSVLFKHYNLLPLMGYRILPAIDYCISFEAVCSRLLDHIQCPPEARTLLSCSEARNYSTFVGTCQCGLSNSASAFAVPSSRVQEDIYDALIGPNADGLMVEGPAGRGSIDFCGSYEALCHAFMERIACPSELVKLSSGCNIENGTGAVSQFNGICTCGGITKPLDRSRELGIDAALAFDLLHGPATYRPPSAAPPSAWDPFKQLVVLKQN